MKIIIYGNYGNKDLLELLREKLDESIEIIVLEELSSVVFDEHNFILILFLDEENKIGVNNLINGNDYDKILVFKEEDRELLDEINLNKVDIIFKSPVDPIEMHFAINNILDKTDLIHKINNIDKIIQGKKLYADGIDETEEVRVNSILLELGIIGEKGSKDIERVIDHVIKHNIDMSQTTLREICSALTDKPKIMEQKMRRAINVAIVNLANLGLEDSQNAIFKKYSNSLFNFGQVKREMDFIRGKTEDRGVISMKQFISGIISLINTY